MSESEIKRIISEKRQMERNKIIAEEKLAQFREASKQKCLSSFQRLSSEFEKKTDGGVRLKELIHDFDKNKIFIIIGFECKYGSIPTEISSYAKVRNLEYSSGHGDWSTLYSTTTTTRYFSIVDGMPKIVELYDFSPAYDYRSALGYGHRSYSVVSEFNGEFEFVEALLAFAAEKLRK